jgi:hypothetical protein
MFRHFIVLGVAAMRRPNGGNLSQAIRCEEGTVLYPSRAKDCSVVSAPNAIARARADWFLPMRVGQLRAYGDHEALPKRSINPEPTYFWADS